MMNKRYTDIDALIAMLRNNIDLPFYGGDSWAHIVQIKDKLIEHIKKNAPVADVVEVVRCKDCKMYTHVIGKGENKIFGCSYMGRDVKPDAFCSYGERKDETNDT